MRYDLKKVLKKVSKFNDVKVKKNFTVKNNTAVKTVKASKPS